jgi:hypothetical protein
LAPTYKVIGSSFRWEAGRKDEGRKRADALMFDVRGLMFDVRNGGGGHSAEATYTKVDDHPTLTVRELHTER